MSLLNELLSSQGGELTKQLARNFNIDEAAAQKALGELLPAISGGLQRNSADPGGLASLGAALGSGRHQRYIEEPSTLTQPETIADGNSILGHILGGKEVSRNVASQAAERTGIDAGILKQMLPMVAAAAMGALSSRSGAATAEGQSGVAGALSSLLDRDGDGSVADDLLDMAKKFF